MSQVTTSSVSKTLILGIGNLLMGDEGVGVHLIERLRQQSWPLTVDLLDGGTGGFHLLTFFESYPRIILIDATLDQRPAGTIRRIRPRFASDFPKALSTHDIGLKDMLSGLQLLGRFPDIQLLAVSIDTVQPMHIGLSPPIEAILPQLEVEVRACLDAWPAAVTTNSL